LSAVDTGVNSETSSELVVVAGVETAWGDVLASVVAAPADCPWSTDLATRKAAPKAAATQATAVPTSRILQAYARGVVTEAGDRPTPAPEHLQRSSELLERLLADPELRRRFQADPAAVLAEAGLPDLAAELAADGGFGELGLLTLERRESRSSLAGVMVAAAAEGFELLQSAVHAAPALAHDAGREVDRLVDPAKHRAAPARGAPAGHTPAGHAPAPRAPADAAAQPSLGAPAAIPDLAAKAPAAPAHPHPASETGDAPALPAHPAPASRAHDHHSGRRAPAAALQVDEAPDRQLAYPGDTASPQRLAAWMAAGATRAGLPPELPVMAALTESGTTAIATPWASFRCVWGSGTGAPMPVIRTTPRCS
jgi:hypothetical protein